MIYSINWDSYFFRTANSNGRADQFLEREDFVEGTYKIKFETLEYFKQQDKDCFFPHAEVYSIFLVMLLESLKKEML